MKVTLTVCALLFLFCAHAATAQHDHSSLHVVQVKGSEHPELIPDVLAYTAFFEERSVAVDASAASKERAERLLKLTGFGTEDEIQFRLEMTQFRAKYDSIQTTYQRLAEQRVAGPKLLYGALLGLVKETQGHLKSSLSKNGQAAIQTWILYWKHSSTYEVLGDDVPTEVLQ